MRYTTTILLSIRDLDDIISGKLRMQVGQWVMLPNARTSSRYVGITKAETLWFCHGLFGYHSPSKFLNMCKSIKNHKGSKQ